MKLSDNSLIIRVVRSTLYQWLLIAVFSGLFLCLVTTKTNAINHSFDTAAQRTSDNSKSLIRTVAVGKGVAPIVIAAKDPFRPDSTWVYAAKEHSLPKDYFPQLREVNVATTKTNSPARMQPVAAAALEKLFVQAKARGHQLIIESSYRSPATQQQIFDESVAIRGLDETRSYIAVPGTSEHHTGLAVDVDSLTSQCMAYSNACALSTADASWIKQHAPDYGFIIRYPLGKENITGYNYEPWHLRYIGNSARSLTDSSLTLDEFYSNVEIKS